MAESIAESRAYIDSIGNEHSVVDTDLGFNRICAGLGIDSEELVAMSQDSAPEELVAKMGESYGRDMALGLKALWAAAIDGGFTYGVRWEQQRGAQEELTMIALALKNVGLPELDAEPVTPERGVEILIEQLVRLRRG